MNKKASVLFILLIPFLFSSCLKQELDKQCSKPYIDFVAYNVNTSTLKVSFKDITTENGIITSRRWDFGDGTSYTGETPPDHTYPTLSSTQPSKKYRVKYTVDNECGESYWTQDITVGPCLATVKFASSVVDTSIQFTNQSTSPSAATYTWTFGDGTSLTTSATTITKNYAYNGTYTVILKASNACGDNYYTSTVTVCKKPIAYLSYSTTNGNTVNFAGSATNATTYQMNYGNGVFTAAQSSPSFTYTYPATGTYTATLTASNACGSVTYPRTVTISCIGVGAMGVYGYSMDDLTFTFSQNAITNATSYQWTFGDGTYSYVQNPSTKTYPNPGVYVLTRYASNSCATSSASVSLNVPMTLSNTSAPSTTFSGVTAQNTSSVYYLGSNGYFYLFNGSQNWTNYGSVPITYNSSAKLYRDSLNNIWVYGTNGVAKWTGSGWSYTSSMSLGYSSGATITALDVDINGNVWTSANGQLRRGSTLIYSTSTITSIKYSSRSNRVWFTVAGSSYLYYYNLSTATVGYFSVPNASTNSGNLQEDGIDGYLYFTSNYGIIKITSWGSYDSYFYSGNTSYLTQAPLKIQVDNRGYIWALVSSSGDFIRLNNSVSSTNAKRYNVVPDINYINDFYVINGDIFLAKNISNGAVRVY